MQLAHMLQLDKPVCDRHWLVIHGMPSLAIPAVTVLWTNISIWPFDLYTWPGYGHGKPMCRVYRSIVM